MSTSQTPTGTALFTTPNTENTGKQSTVATPDEEIATLLRRRIETLQIFQNVYLSRLERAEDPIPLVEAAERSGRELKEAIDQLQQHLKRSLTLSEPTTTTPVNAPVRRDGETPLVPDSPTYPQEESSRRVLFTSEPTRAPYLPSPVTTKPEEKEVNVKDPNSFNGTMQDYRRWRFECKEVFRMRTSLNTDDKKISYMGTLMAGAALTWYQMWRESMDRRGTEASLGEFYYDLDVAFKNPQEIHEYRSEVVKTRQGATPFNDYAIKYRDLCLKAELDPDHQVQLFINSLDQQTTSNWYPSELPATFDETVKSIRAALQVSINTNKTPAKGAQRGSGSFTAGKGPTLSTRYSGNPSKPGAFAANEGTPTFQHRKEKGLCTRCGMANHEASKCRVYPLAVTNKENYEKWVKIKEGKVTVSAVVSAGSGPPETESVEDDKATPNITDQAYIASIREFQPRTTPPSTLPCVIARIGKRKLPARVLVDSGAMQSFISQNFVKTHGLATELLPKRIKVELADGVTQITSTHQVPSQDFWIGNRHGNIQLPVLSMKNHDVILGMDWLSVVNPDINWESHTLTWRDGSSTQDLSLIHI